MAADTATKTELRTLNQRTFEAEDDPATARAALDPHLSSDFYIVRAGGAVQDKQAMLDHAEADTSGRRRSIKNVEVRFYGDDAAVVRTLLSVLEPTGAELGQYWNTKVFVRNGTDWRCVAWHVTQSKTT